MCKEKILIEIDNTLFAEHLPTYYWYIVIENHKQYIEIEQFNDIIVVPKDKIKTLVAELIKLDV